jgi:hypothetical protein
LPSLAFALGGRCGKRVLELGPLLRASSPFALFLLSMALVHEGQIGFCILDRLRRDVCVCVCAW